MHLIGRRERSKDHPPRVMKIGEEIFGLLRHVRVEKDIYNNVLVVEIGDIAVFVPLDQEKSLKSMVGQRISLLRLGGEEYHSRTV